MRTIFGNIISEKNLEPKTNIEYIYNLDDVWLNHEMIPVQKHTIVENVHQENAGNYTFNIKGDTVRYECSYGWAFIENTKRNIEILNQIEQETIVYKQQEQKIEILKNNLDWLFSEKKNNEL